MNLSIMDFDTSVRSLVYFTVINTGVVPLADDVASSLDATRGEVLASFRRLADARIVALQPDRGELLMVPPFSAVPTPFFVVAGSIKAFANCIWDALGIAAMLHSDARIQTSCGDCGTSMDVEVRDGNVLGEGVVHFAIPARSWWKDIVFT
jgi:hypothetical protein